MIDDVHVTKKTTDCSWKVGLQSSIRQNRAA